MFLWEFWSRDKNVLRNLNHGTNLLKNEQQLQTFVYEHFPDIKKIYEEKCRKHKGQMCKTFLDMYADRL
jgi:mannose/fructose/N-acetylgalactosamine-specific phosphotransferase system component IID